jgi:hypothetical protein
MIRNTSDERHRYRYRLSKERRTDADRADHNPSHWRTDDAGHVLARAHQADGVGQVLAWDQRRHERLLGGNQKRQQRPVQERGNRQMRGSDEAARDVHG